jgi:hypothetical protein
VQHAPIDGKPTNSAIGIAGWSRIPRIPTDERIRALREAGIVLVATATNIAEGRAAAKAGVHAVAAPRRARADNSTTSHDPCEPPRTVRHRVPVDETYVSIEAVPTEVANSAESMHNSTPVGRARA